MSRPGMLRFCLALTLGLFGMATPAPAQPAPHTDRFGDPLPDGAVVRLGTTRLRARASAVAFAADGKTILTATGVSGLARWDATTGRLRDEVALPGPPGTRSWFSPDGKLLAIGEADGLGIWDTESGKRLRLLPCRPVQVGPVAFGPGMLATAEFNGKEGQINLWDLGTGTGKAQPVTALPSYANALTFDRAGKRLFAAVDNHSLRCWDVATRKQLWQNDHWASHIALSLDDAVLVADSYPGREPITLWDSTNGKQVGALAKDRPVSSQLAWVPDGSTLVQGTYRDGVLLWDMRARKLSRRVPAHDALLAVAPDGRSIVTAGRMLERWDIATGKPLYADTRAHGHVGAVDSIAFAPDGRSLASTGEDNTVRVWDLSDGRFRVLRTDAPGGRMRAAITGANMYVGTAVPLEFTPDGRLLLTDVAAGALALTEVATGKEARRFTLPTAKDGVVVTSAARLTADGRRLVVLGQTQVLHAGSSLYFGHRMEPLRGWDVTDGREVLSRTVPCNLVENPAITPDGRVVVLPSMGKLVDVHTGREWLLQAKAGSVGMPIAISGDGRLLATCEPGLFSGPTTALQVFEILTGRRVARVEAHLGRSRAIGFSGDGRLLAAGGSDALLVWQMPGGKRALRLEAQGRLTQWHADGFATALDFSPGGKALATGHADGTVHIWDLAPAWQAHAAPAAKIDPAACWTDLAAADAATAYRAIERLAAAPEAMPLLKQNLRAAKLDPAWLAKQIGDLGSETFETRDRAMRELQQVVEPAESALRRAHAKPASLEARRRIEQLLQSLTTTVPSPDVLRQLRALAVLERIGSEPARALLRELAAGAPDARLTREASATLARLTRFATAVR